MTSPRAWQERIPSAHEGLQLALFSTSLSPNRDQNRTNMLKSPPKLLFWFQDDAIWVPVSSLQMQAGGGEREEGGRNAAPEQSSCSEIQLQSLPGAESCSASRCKSNRTLQSLPRTWSLREGPNFPQMAAKPAAQPLLAVQDPSHRLQVQTSGGSKRRWIQPGPRGISERHIYS